MAFRVLDFESFSEANLKKVGAYNYARHPTTKVLCLSYGDDELPALMYPVDLYAEPHNTELYALAIDPNVIFVAHGAQFEIHMWREHMVPRGYPMIPTSRWHCTMSVALNKGLPAGLDQLSRALRVPVLKDTEGSKLTVSLSKKNKKTGKYPEQTEEVLTRVGDYCITDVRSELHVLKRTKNFSGRERSIWDLDRKINERGIFIDEEFVRASLDCINAALPETIAAFRNITGLEPGQTEKFKEWLYEQGLPLDNLRKETVDTLIGEDEDDSNYFQYEYENWEDVEVPVACEKALRLRKIATSTSLKKLPAMLEVRGHDGRARELVQYSGAAPTHRWTGRILQPHNFPRGLSHDTQDLVDAILRRDLGWLRVIYGDVIAAVSSGLRHALQAAPEKRFLMGDYTQIEARIVLAFAGQYDALQLFVEGDPYSDMAEKIYKHPVNKKDNMEERQIDKNTVLGCGFGLGWKTFRRRYCPKETVEFAKECIRAYRKDFAPKVPYFWYALQDASAKAVWDGTSEEVNGFTYRMEGEWLTCTLPNGSKMWYYGPEKQRKPLPWDPDTLVPSWSYMSMKQGQWKSVDTHGGMLCGHIVQKSAREILATAMFKCEDAGLPIVLTVHDEIVPETNKEVDLLKQCMLDVDPWVHAYKIPIGTELSQGTRYQK